MEVNAKMLSIVIALPLENNGILVVPYVIRKDIRKILLIGSTKENAIEKQIESVVKKIRYLDLKAI